MNLYFGTQAAAVAGGAGSVNGNATQGGTSYLFPTGGGGGAGLDSANGNYVGGRALMGTSGAHAFLEVASPFPPTVNNGAQAKWTLWGTGGAGARSHPTNAAARGGDGAQGAGGGGGPAALNGSGGSTAGGSGGNGIVVITTYF
jgi:hypothetical protein